VLRSELLYILEQARLYIREKHVHLLVNYPGTTP